MELFSLRFRRATGPCQFHSAVMSSLTGVTAIMLLCRAAWPYPQLHKLTIALAAGFLLLIAVALYRVWKIHRIIYPLAVAGDKALTQALNATMRTYLWANAGFALLALTVFQFSLLLR
jgi:hypothetical protein